MFSPFNPQDIRISPFDFEPDKTDLESRHMMRAMLTDYIHLGYQQVYPLKPSFFEGAFYLRDADEEVRQNCGAVGWIYPIIAKADDHQRYLPIMGVGLDRDARFEELILPDLPSFKRYDGKTTATTTTNPTPTDRPTEAQSELRSPSTRLAGGHAHLLLRGSEEREQHLLALSSWSGVITSDHRSDFGKGFFDSVVADVVGSHLADGKEGRKDRQAGISDILRVTYTWDRTAAPAMWWAHDGDGRGRGLFASRGRYGKGFVVKSKKKAQTEQEKRDALLPPGAGQAARNPIENPENTTQIGAVTRLGSVERTDTDNNQSSVERTDEGEDGLKTVASLVFGLASADGGGPITAGAISDKHHVHTNADGEIINQGHLDLTAPWFLDSTRDAPPLVDSRYYEPDDVSGVPWAVFLRYDPRGVHPKFGNKGEGGQAGGLFRWQTYMPFFMPPEDGDPPPYPPKKDPPPYIPPPFPPVPPPWWPPKQPWPPTPPQPPKGGGRDQGEPADAVGHIPSWPIDPLIDEDQFEPIQRPDGNYQLSNGALVTPQGQYVVPAPWGHGRVVLPPLDASLYGDGVADEIKHIEYDRDPDKKVNLREFICWWGEVCHNAMLFHPQHSQGEDLRYNMAPSQAQLGAVRSAPPVMRMDTVAAELGLGWQYEKNPGSARYPSGIGYGAVMYMPANYDADMLDDNEASGATTPENTNDSHVLLWDVRLTFGQIFRSGENAAKPRLAISQRYDSGVLKWSGHSSNGAETDNIAALTAAGNFSAAGSVSAASASVTGVVNADTALKVTNVDKGAQIKCDTNGAFASTYDYCLPDVGQNTKIQVDYKPVEIDDTDSPYSASVNELVVVDTSSDVVTVTLPEIGVNAYVGDKIIVADYGNGATNNITINASGSDEINGGASTAIEASYTAIEFIAVVGASDNYWIKRCC